MKKNLITQKKFFSIVIIFVLVIIAIPSLFIAKIIFDIRSEHILIDHYFQEGSSIMRSIPDYPNASNNNLTLYNNYGPDSGPFLQKNFHSDDDYNKVFAYYAKYFSGMGWIVGKITSYTNPNDPVKMGTDYSQIYRSNNKNIHIYIRTFIPTSENPNRSSILGSYSLTYQ